MGSFFDGRQPFAGGGGGPGRPEGAPAGFMGRQTSSVADFLASYSPRLLPGRGGAFGPAGDAVLACVQALYDAADDDSATGGPDLTRRIYPVIATVNADGFRKLPEAESAEYAQQVVQSRMTAPDGPPAPLRVNDS